MDRPITNCYWVQSAHFLAGEYPRTLDDVTSQEKLDALVHAGVRAFIDLTEETEGLLPYAPLLAKCGATGVSHERFPVPDLSLPPSRELTASILDAIDRHIADNRVVYVHCWGGVGRTGVVVGCWLARHGHRGQSALTRLRHLWRQCPKSARKASPETREQAQYVMDWVET